MCFYTRRKSDNIVGPADNIAFGKIHLGLLGEGTHRDAAMDGEE
jgi:hypothetical protein